MDTFDVRDAFGQLQRQLLVKLGAADLTTHSGTKGDEAELDWLAVLNDFLPMRYQAAKGFAVDVNGQRSEQQDVMIFDRQYSPLLFNLGGFLHVPAESIYAVFETKPELDKAYLTYAGVKAESVRVLERTSAAIVHAGGEIENPKEPFAIIAGILARRAGWTPPFGAAFLNAVGELGANQVLNLGCVLEAGTFEWHDGALTMDEEHPLMAFLIGLLASLQSLGTVPALDLARWRAAGLT